MTMENHSRAPIDEASNDQAKRDSIARSEANILEWMSYLPQDCVETMIRMGWDVST
jgi:hypothetical protein